MLRSLVSTAPCDGAVLVIDETGDRRYGTHTAHVGQQYLGSLGKVDSGIVTVHVLYDTPNASVPLKFVPYTPAHHFERKTSDPAFKTKPQLALDLIDAVRFDWPYRAVIADSFYGRNEVFQTHLIRQHIPFVLALPASHTWWPADQPGSALELALRARLGNLSCARMPMDIKRSNGSPNDSAAPSGRTKLFGGLSSRRIRWSCQKIARNI
ncbi:transposase [Deinococcus sp. QL22]|uniref:transposase n=1 Tax=Deinococcus sp. QL22 TaxID=2939437 RepID=UPI0020180102|nr:transposase [Deinococcus sp. QL22]UQN08468.1 transposase [Deinococcus sp. QL22]